MNAPIVTLTTDFGRDWYAGAMRGAVLRRAPNAHVVDITHDVPPHDVLAGAFMLAAACTAFPSGSIHVAIVDPGVGGARRPVAIAIGPDVLIGPDNGLLSLAVGSLVARSRGMAPVRAVTLDPVRVGVSGLSHTFHGRDLFAPAAGALAEGEPLDALGEPVADWIDLSVPPAQAEGDAIDAVIVHIDSFGSAVTNVPADVGGGLDWEWKANAGDPVRQHAAYEEVPVGHSLLIAGSAGYLEVAVREGRADQVWKLARGSRVSLRRRTSAMPPERPSTDARRSP